MRKNSVINGKKLSYIDLGKGQPILFLHGWGRSGDDFLPLINSLNDEYRFISIDFPGFGESEEPDEGNVNLDAYSDVVEKLIEELKIKDTHVICHSFGGRIAIKLASRGKLTGKIVFTGGAGIEPPKPLGFKLKVLHFKFMKFLVKTPFYSQYRDDLLANSGSADYKNASPIMKNVLSLAVNEDLSHLLSKIENDCLLYWGENDDATPVAYGEQMNREIDNSELIIKPGLTHYAFLEASDDFNNQVAKFLGGGSDGK